MRVSTSVAAFGPCGLSCFRSAAGSTSTPRFLISIVPMPRCRSSRARRFTSSGHRSSTRKARANGVGSLLLGIPNGKKLTYVGKVGTGFGDAALDEIALRLGELAAKANPFEEIPAADARGVHWVKPTLVGEVEFAEWTRGGRLRQPSWRGWRTDKDPKDVVRES